MALITCTECGKQFSDKAKNCPNCGCPTSAVIEAREEILRNSTEEDKMKSVLDFEKVLYQLALQKYISQKSQVTEIKYSESESESRYDVRCPRCGSKQFSAKTKGFGLGKAVVGGLLLGPIGLLGGAIGSNKTMVVCLKCGHEWRV